MTTPEAPPSTQRRLAAVLLLAFVVRAAVLVCESRLPLFTHHRLDAQMYDEAGRVLASGDWLFGRGAYFFNPLYAYLVGVVYATLGAGPWPLRVVQLVFGLGNVALIYDSARRVAGDRWGSAAGVIAALYGPFAFFETQVLSEGFGAFLQSLLMWGVLRAFAAPEGRGLIARWAAIGATLGLCVLTRGNAVFLAVPVALAALWAGGGGRPLAALALGGALSLVPVTARNVVRTGHFAVLTAHGGVNLYVGNGPGASGTYRIPDEVPSSGSNRDAMVEYRRVAERRMGRRLTLVEADRYWRDLTLRTIARHPVTWLRLLVEKTWLFWNAREIPNTEDYEFMRTLDPALALPLVQFGTVAPFALMGTLALLASRRKEDRFLAAFNLAGCASLVAFFVLARYRLPCVPGLIVAAVVWLRDVKVAWDARRTRTLVASALGVALAAAVVFWPKLPTLFDDQYFKLGFAWHVQGHLPEAEDAYRNALRLTPTHLSARKNLAMLLESRGDLDGARREWEALLRVAPTQLPTGARYLDEAREHLRTLGAPTP